MSLPSPTFAFTIPSVHDDTILRCRLYVLRKHLSLRDNHAPKAAIIAHPYAPLGGCYDDPIVDSIGGVLLRAGYIVGTFNFRGASGSAGRTSWSAKPELGDYVSFYGFMIHYLNGLMSGFTDLPDTDPGQLSTVPSATEEDGSTLQAKTVPRLILAGYSYGSMIASHLPRTDSVVKLFQTAAEGSAESEIRLRALHLSSQTLKDLKSSIVVRRSYHNSDTSRSPSILMGGFESGAVENRIEQESRRSLDVRKSLDRVCDRIHTRSHRLTISHERPDTDSETQAQAHQTMAVPQVCYLLVSPVLSPAAAFATFFSTPSFQGIRAEETLPGSDTRPELSRCPCLAVHGSKDRFTSVKKLRAWGETLNQIAGSAFQSHEVDGAGHFWHETGALDQMKKCISDWASSI